MKRALSLARRSEGMTSPNPMVGAVLVKGNKAIAEGRHLRSGAPHAEAVALKKAGRRAQGATIYVNLEPCCHTDKTTPPCTRDIIKAGVRKVVAAMRDPNPKVSGKGLRALRRAGVTVQTGILEAEARRLNEAYVKYMTTGRPFVTLKTAMTLDGKIADPAGDSKWITGVKARRLVHRMRSRSDALLTAIGTVLADDPELTVRDNGNNGGSAHLKRGYVSPLRVVIDPGLKIPTGARLLQVPPQTLIVTKTDNRKTKKLIETGIKVILYKDTLELDWLMKRLARMGVMTVMIEGGSSLAGRALMEGVVDRVAFFVAPKIVGGEASYPATGGREFRLIGEALRVSGMKARRVGEDLLIEGYVGEQGDMP